MLTRSQHCANNWKHPSVVRQTLLRPSTVKHFTALQLPHKAVSCSGTARPLVKAPLTICKSASLKLEGQQSDATSLPTSNGWPLLTAAKSCQWDECQQLLDKGIKASTDILCMAIWYATRAQQAQLVTNLLQSAPPMPIKSGKGMALESAALQHALEKTAWRGDLPTCQALIRAVPELLATPAVKDAITVASEFKRTQLASFLLDACLELKQGNYKELLQAAMCSAAEGSNIAMLQLLLDRGADVNGGQASFKPWVSPLWFALFWSHVGAVKFLVEHGAHVHADPTMPSSESGSALKAAIHAREPDCEPDVVELLLKYKAVSVGCVELLTAVKDHNVAVLELVLNSEARMCQELRENQQKRAKCMGKALAWVVRECLPVEDADRKVWRFSTKVEIARALVAAPPHWGPITPEVLSAGVRAATHLIRKKSLSIRVDDSFCSVMKLLKEAGADLDVDRGALLRAAARSRRSKVLKAVIDAGADLRRYGRAALKSVLPTVQASGFGALTRGPGNAVILLRAGALAGSDPVTARQLLLKLELGGDCDEKLWGILESLQGMSPEVTLEADFWAQALPKGEGVNEESDSDDEEVHEEGRSEDKDA